MAKLRVIAGPYHGVTFELGTDRITVGRDLDNVIRFPASLVSRHHAEIVREGETYKLRDLNSTNGSFVDGKPVAESVIQPGNKILLADVELEFVPEVPAASAAPEAGPTQPALSPPPKPVDQIRIPSPPQRGVWRPPRPQLDHVPVTLPPPPAPIPAAEPARAPAAPPPVVDPPSAATTPPAVPSAPAPDETQPVSAPAQTKPILPALAVEPLPPGGRVIVVRPPVTPRLEPQLPPAPAAAIPVVVTPAPEATQKGSAPAEVTRSSPAPTAAPPPPAGRVIVVSSPSVPQPALKVATAPRQPIFIRSGTNLAKAPGASPKEPVVAPARPAIRTVEVAEAPAKAPPAAAAPAVVRQVSAPSAAAVVDEPVVAEPPRYRRAWFALVAFVGLLLIIAGYTLDSNPLRFFGIVAVILGGLCVIRDWSPVPGK